MLKDTEQEILETIYNMILDQKYLIMYNIIFNPTPKQEEEYWCDRCDGFHKTKNCPLLRRYENTLR